MASLHPEIAEELAKIEENHENTSVILGIEPNPFIKNHLLDQITNRQAEKPAIPLYPTRLFAYGMAACLTLLLVSSIAAFNYWERWKSSENELLALRSSNQQYATNLANMNAYKGILQDPDFKKVHLASTTAFPGNEIMVYWNAKNTHVMVDMLNLPENDAEHQYQLWAIVNGKPVDAGVFDVKKGQKTMFQMKNIQGAQAFAVTLEPKGGSTNPTMDKMYAMGKI
nr:anti-sigma factor [Solitalea agri]